MDESDCAPVVSFIAPSINVRLKIIGVQWLKSSILTSVVPANRRRRDDPLGDDEKDNWWVGDTVSPEDSSL